MFFVHFIKKLVFPYMMKIPIKKIVLFIIYKCRSIWTVAAVSHIYGILYIALPFTWPSSESHSTYNAEFVQLNTRLVQVLLGLELVKSDKKIK